MDLDLRSEFSCQPSLEARNIQIPLSTSYAWDISHALATLYHPYTTNPSALTEYLKRKLQVQRAKRRSRSHPAQVEPNVPLERNTIGENPWPPAEIVPCPSDQHLIPPDRVPGPLYPREEA